MLSGLYTQFLDAGYNPDFFWELSIGEVMDLLDSYIRSLERKRDIREAIGKDLIVILRNHAHQIVDMISASTSENGKPLSLHDYYPDLFDDQDVLTGTEAEVARYRAAMENYALAYNRKFNAEGGENNGGSNTGETEGTD